MQAYTNQFSISMNTGKNEVLINFFQNVPPVDAFLQPTEQDVETVSLPVAQLIISLDCAQNLTDLLSNLLSGKAEAPIK